MALPFNLVAVFVFLTLQPADLQSDLQEDVLTNSTAPANQSLSWPDVGRGIIVSMGQVYAVDELEPSLMMNLAVLLSSPLLFLMANIGAALGTLLSLTVIEVSDYEDVRTFCSPPSLLTASYFQLYHGIFGYNSLLSMAAVSCVFFPLTISSFLAGIVNVMATVFIQRALAHNMSTVIKKRLYLA